MFIRRSLQAQKFLKLGPNYLLKRNSQQSTATKIVNNLKTVFSYNKEKKPQKDPLVKSLVVGKFDNEFFGPLETQTHERFREFCKWMMPIENYMRSCADSREKLNKEEVLSHLRELEVFRAHVGEPYGLNLLETESLKLMETLSTVPWVATFLVKNHIKPLQILSKYGSENQKLEYFPKIISGEFIPAICLTESASGTNINNINSLAVANKDGMWTLNGKKTFVVNGTDSNLFLVFARNVAQNEFSPTTFSLFLVERDDKTVTCDNVYKSISRHEIPVCTVSFNDAVIPEKNVIGKAGCSLDMLMESLVPGNQNIDAQAISILRNFMNQLTLDTLEMKHFDREFYQFDAVKKVLADMSFSLYTMESMAYFTSGLTDLYENQDVQLEKIITELYCADQCLKHIQAGLKLMGTQSYLDNNSYIQAFHDALCLLTLDMNNIDANVYVTTVALQYCAQFVHGDVYKKRNAPMFPFYALKNFLQEKTKSSLDIPDHLHPSLKFGGIFLEESINKLEQSIMSLFIEYGGRLPEKHMELYRVTEMLTHIYGTIANLARSNRSYSIGLENTDIEKNIVVSLACIAKTKVFAAAQDIEDGDQFNGDYVRKQTIDLAYEKHKYPMSHPLDRTF